MNSNDYSAFTRTESTGGSYPLPNIPVDGLSSTLSDVGATNVAEIFDSSTKQIQAGVFAQLRSSVLVDEEFVAPPRFYRPAGFVQQLELSLDFTVNDAALIREMIRTNTGVILWYPMLGVANVARFGIVPGAATSTNLETLPAFWGGNAPGHTVVATTLTWPSVAPMPYAVEPNQQITVGPTLGDDISKAVAFAGRLELYGSTLGAGRFALNGVLDAGAVEDVRNIAQHIVGGTSTSFDTVTTSVSAMSAKEGVTNVRIDKGVAVLMGVPETDKYRAPDLGAHDEINGFWTGLTVMGTAPTTITMGGGIGGALIGIGSVWYSPWGTTLAVDATTSLLPANAHFNVRAPYTGIWGVVDANIGFGVALQTNAGALSQILHFEYQAKHVYGLALADGSIRYYTYIDEGSCGTVAGRVPASEIPVLLEVQSRPNSARTSFLGNGMYIGTHVKIYGRPLQSEAQGASIVYQGTPFINMRARSVDAEGAVGSVRVMKYRDIGNDQVVSVRGKINAMMEARVTTAPYVRTAVSAAPTGASTANIIFATEMYDSPGSPWKRTWELEQLKIFEERLRRMSMAEFLDLVLKGGNKVVAAGHAAGFFGGLGRKIGELFGGGDFGEKVGSFVGRNVVPLLGEAVGIPLPPMAAGRYGNGAGSVIGSTGQFGTIGGRIRQRQ